MRYFLIFLLFVFLPVFAEDGAQAEEPAADVGEAADGSETPDEEAFNREVLDFENRAGDFQNEIQQMLGRKIADKRDSINEKYADMISERELSELQNRRDAIFLLEQFLQKYSDNVKYTPKVMYRLAELYYEKSMIDYAEQTKKYDEDLERLEKGEITEDPVLPEIDFSNSIRLYTEIIQKFPNFEHIGSVYYLLGYCYAESGNFEKAVEIWLTLLEKNLAGENYVELCLRLGDYYFAENNLQKAEVYYSLGKQFPESNFYDQIVYKLAWTYYRQSRLADAVGMFTDLLFYSDEMKSRGIDKGQDLRKEAIQYIAISFADDEWGSADKAIDHFGKLEQNSFEIEVFTQLGKYFDENNKYAEAEKIYRHLLSHYPNHENSPKIHNALILLCNRAREFEKAETETEIFATKYMTGSEWFEANKNNAVAVRDAAELVKAALLDTAVFHHKQAQAFKEKNESENAVNEYKKASEFYREYLRNFPYTDDNYDVTYSFADTLFYQGDIAAAVVAYERVRDDKKQDKFRDDAAFQVFFCYSSLWEQYSGKDQPASEKAGKPLNLLEKKLVESSDAYLKLAKEQEDKPVVAYNVARIYYDHELFDNDALPRYIAIIDEFHDSEPALMASKDIIAYYTAKKDWINVAKWSKVFEEKFAGRTKDGKYPRAEFATYRASAMFNYARQLEEEGKHAEAAEEYLKIVAENPRNKDADKALYNAAVNYSRATMFESALTQHERIYNEYPESPLAPQSLYLVAYNAEMGFEHEKAVDAYKKLCDKYPNYKEKSNAIFNSALLLEKLQKYGEASKYYKLYYAEESSKPEGKEALFDVARMQEKAKNWKGAIKSYDNFISTFANDSSMTNLVAKSHYRIAKIYEDNLRSKKMTKVSYEKLLSFVVAKKAASGEAGIYAAEAKFKLLEDEFNAYIRLKIGGKNDKQLEANLKKKVAAMKALEAKYNEVLKFQVYEWMMAAMYRIGYLYQSFSDSLFEAEPPAGLTEEEEEIYTDMLKQQAEPIEEQAITYYSKALEKARELKIFNQWTQLITEKLAVMRPAEYKVGKTPKFATDDALNTGFVPPVPLEEADKISDAAAKQNALALNYLVSGKQEESEKAAKAALKADERNAEAVVTLATIYFERKMFELAESALEIAEKRDPENYRLHRLYGFLFYKLGDDNKAAEHLKKAVAINSELPEARNLLAVIAMKVEDYSAAKEQLEAALKTKSDFLHAKLNLALAYKGLEDYKNSAAVLNELETDGSLPENLRKAVLFDKALLYLDADVEGDKTTARFDTAVKYFNDYLKSVAGDENFKDEKPLAEGYIKEANIEKKKLEFTLAAKAKAEKKRQEQEAEAKLYQQNKEAAFKKAEESNTAEAWSKYLEEFPVADENDALGKSATEKLNALKPAQEAPKDAQADTPQDAPADAGNTPEQENKAEGAASETSGAKAEEGGTSN